MTAWYCEDRFDGVGEIFVASRAYEVRRLCGGFGVRYRFEFDCDQGLKGEIMLSFR